MGSGLQVVHAEDARCICTEERVQQTSQHYSTQHIFGTRIRDSRPGSIERGRLLCTVHVHTAYQQAAIRRRTATCCVGCTWAAGRRLMGDSGCRS